MAQEVYVVLFEHHGFDWSYGGRGDYCEREFRGVFDSIEKARQYCEDPNHYLDDVDTDYYPERKVKTSWDSSGKIYTVVDYVSVTYPKEDYETFYFSIKTTNLQ